MMQLTIWAMERKSFADMDCSVAQCLEVVGEWWSMLIVRDAFLGVTRFEDFQRRLGISRNILQQRLGQLVDAGVLQRVPYSEHPPRDDYRLTDKGRDLWPVLTAMRQWGDAYAARTGHPSRSSTTPAVDGRRPGPGVRCVRGAGRSPRRARRPRPRPRRRADPGASGGHRPVLNRAGLLPVRVGPKTDRPEREAMDVRPPTGDLVGQSVGDGLVGGQVDPGGRIGGHLGRRSGRWPGPGRRRTPPIRHGGRPPAARAARRCPGSRRRARPGGSTCGRPRSVGRRRPARRGPVRGPVRVPSHAPARRGGRSRRRGRARPTSGPRQLVTRSSTGSSPRASRVISWAAT